ncbi:MAG: radical SAM protein [Actinomycetota bacterium]|nr:radical SAM protein [Actinomycetota bacterium]
MKAPAIARRDGCRAAAQTLQSFDGPLGAYVHVPFCSRICPFCPYNKVIAERTLVHRYFSALLREIDWYAQAMGRPFDSLYVGGGTPTLFPGELAEVLERIPVSGERGIEVLPTHATPERLDRLAAMGFDSVSIGSQSFNPEVLYRLGRPYGAEASRVAVSNARERFATVDVDLIVDVAWAKERRLAGAFLADVASCMEMGVDQVSTYPLMRFGYTPFGKAHHDRRLEHQVLGAAADLAEAGGYERRSVWTLNRIGSPSYTSITRPRYLGMGAGSASFAGKDFFVNHFGVETYIGAVMDGRLPMAKRIHLGRWAGATYDAFWQAYAGGLDFTALSRSYGVPASALLAALSTPLVLTGAAKARGSQLRLTRRGFDHYHDLERFVTYHFIEPLWAEMLAEHLAEPDAAQGRARWVTEGEARRGRAWSVAERFFERPPY